MEEAVKKSYNLIFKRFDITQYDRVKPIFTYEGNDCEISIEGSTVLAHVPDSMDTLFCDVPLTDIIFENIPERWCRVGDTDDDGQITTYYALFAANNGLVVVEYAQGYDDGQYSSQKIYRLDYNSNTELGLGYNIVEYPEAGDISKVLESKGLPAFDPAVIDADRDMKKYAHKAPFKAPNWLKNTGVVLDLIGGFLLGLATFWLYIPDIVYDCYKDTSKLRSLLITVFFPVTLVVATVIALIGALKAALEISASGFLSPGQSNDAPYQMPLNFLNGVLGWVLGPVLTTLFSPFLEAMNWIRQGADQLFAEKSDATVKERMIGFLKILTSPIIFALQLIAAPLRGLYYGKDGLGRVLQTFWDQLNAKEYRQSTEVKTEGDYVSIGLREVGIAAIYLALIAFTMVAITLAVAPTGGFAALIMGALEWATGFTAGASVLTTAFMGAGIAAAFTAVGTAVLAGAMKGFMAIAKAVGWVGESTNDVICGTATTIVQKGCGLGALKGNITDHARASAKETGKEIDENAFGEVLSWGAKIVTCQPCFARAKMRREYFDSDQHGSDSAFSYDA